MKPATRAAGALLSALLASACEHGITLHGTIRVPAEVQRAFSAQRPGLVIVRTNIPKTAVLDYQIAVLCEPGAAALTLPFFHDGFGCAKQGEVRVDVRPQTGGTPAACGVAQEIWQGTTEEPPVATGTATVFAGATGSFGCSSGADSFTIELLPAR